MELARSMTADAEPEAAPPAPKAEPEPAATPEPEKPAPGKQATSDDDLLAKIEEHAKSRREKEQAERARHDELEAAKRAAVEAAKAEIRDEVRRELLKDPSNVVRTREDFEQLTARILDGERAAAGDEVGTLRKEISALKAAAEARETRETQEREAAQRQQGYAAVRERFVTHTGDAEKFPLLARLGPDERFNYGMDVARQHPELDDDTIARYVERQLRVTVAKLTGAEAPDDAGRQQQSNAPSSSKGKTLSNDLAAEAAVSVPADPVKAARLDATRLAKSYLQSIQRG